MLNEAGTIHGGVHDYYQVLPGATPAERLVHARSCLDSGQATTARRLLDEIVADLDDDPRAWFTWLLAFFSGRTAGELSSGDREKLKSASERISGLPHDTCWSRGIGIVERLVGEDEAGIAAALDELDRLDDPLRRDVFRHLERVLRGPVKDHVWQRDVDQARVDQTSGRRRDRAWKFFEPDPASPRTRPVRRADVSAGHVLLAVFATAVVAAALTLLGRLALQRGDVGALIAIMVGVAGAAGALANGVQWRFRVERRHAEECEARQRPHAFAGEVDGEYTRHAARFEPDDPNGVSWTVEARAPMCRLRDELVEVYDRQEFESAAVHWLIRFQVRELRREWEDGTLAVRRHRWRVPAAVKGGAVAGAVLAAAGLAWAAQSAARQDAVMSIGAVAAVLIGGWLAAGLSIRILAENMRVAVEEVDREQRETLYWFEYQRWQQVLSDRPTDIEMAAWLDCDRRLLLHQALRAYRLRWSDVGAYASLAARGEGSRRARAKNGPWRYSRYRLLVFLLTADGIRQITVTLDLVKATFNDWQRTGYRCDEVVGARVAVRDDGAREFQLFLADGAGVRVGVTEAGHAGADEDDGILADGAQDAAGLRNTLFLLEGVAADGRSRCAS